MENEDIQTSREVYRGTATITAISVEDLTDKERAKLAGTEGADCAFKIVYSVKCADGQTFDVKEEISHRPLKGKMLEYNKREDGRTPTQIDVAVKDLISQGILPKGSTEQDLALAAADNLVGKEVRVYAKEDPKNDGTGGYWAPKAYFAKSTVARLTGDAKANRIAAFLAGKPAPKAKVVVHGAPVAPSEDDASDMPF